MKSLIVKLKPKSFFHLGEREEWREGSKIYFPADTIFSALCHCHLLLYGEVESFIEGFIKGEPPFLISSAFPFWYKDYYFPLPKNKFLQPKERDILREVLKKKNNFVKKSFEPKDIKKIQFVNLNALKLLLSGKSLLEVILRAMEDFSIKTIPMLSGKHNSDRENKNGKKKPWEAKDTPRIALSRLTNHPGENFFYFGQVYYEENAGLFLLIRLNNFNWDAKLKALFYLLSDEGVGGDRTCGKGLFHKPEFSEIELPDIQDVNGLYCLSPYFPGENERLGLGEGYYELEERKGYIFSPFVCSLRRRSIRLFAEGSVFPHDVGRKGLLVDLTPGVFKKHKVYRYGFLFSLPCCLEAK